MKLYKREFLNDKDGTAFIEVRVEEQNSFLDAQVKIADCSRIVTLDFGVWDRSRKERKERIRKLDRLISNLTTLKHFLEGAF